MCIQQCNIHTAFIIATTIAVCKTITTKARLALTYSDAIPSVPLTTKCAYLSKGTTTVRIGGTFVFCHNFFHRYQFPSKKQNHGYPRHVFSAFSFSQFTQFCKTTRKLYIKITRTTPLWQERGTGLSSQLTPEPLYITKMLTNCFRLTVLRSVHFTSKHNKIMYVKITIIGFL